MNKNSKITLQGCVNDIRNDIVNKKDISSNDFLQPHFDPRARFLAVDEPIKMHDGYQNDVVPNKIHQIWFGDQNKRDEVKIDMWKEYSNAFDYEYRLWTEGDNELLKGFMKPENYELYQSFHSKQDFRACSDVCRCEILKKYGGIYIDADFRPPHYKVAKSDKDTGNNTNGRNYIDFHNIVPMKGACFTNEWYGRDIGHNAIFAMNGFMIASPNHILMQRLVNSMTKNIKSIEDNGVTDLLNSADVLTGPFVLNKCFQGSFNILETMTTKILNMDDHPEGHHLNNEVRDFYIFSYAKDKQAELSKNPHYHFSTFHLAHSDPWAKYIKLSDRQTYDQLDKQYFNTDIPKIIHLVCFGELDESKFELYESYAAQYKYEIKLWDLKKLDELKSFVSPKNYELLMRYVSSKDYWTATDICKYEVLNKFGGIFLDMVFKNLHAPVNEEGDYMDFKNVVSLNGLILTTEDKARHISTNACFVADSFIGAYPNHPIIKRVVDNIRQNNDSLDNNEYAKYAGTAYKTGAFLLNMAVFGVYTLIEKNTFDKLFITNKKKADIPPLPPNSEDKIEINVTDEDELKDSSIKHNPEAPVKVAIKTDEDETDKPEKTYTDSRYPKFCVCMIVKNESKIIRRCLDSLFDFVDYISICDTGSTDNTVKIARDHIRKRQKTKFIPFKIYRHTFKNFAYNRNLSLQGGLELLKFNNEKLDDCYYLLMDADMTLRVGPNFDKKKINGDGYLVFQGIPSRYSYGNLRLGKASLNWTYAGVTHEFCGYDGAKLGDLREDELFVIDLNDGGCKSDKFIRDIRLLSEDLKVNPKNERSMYYLAKSYHDSGDHKNAIEWYLKRIERNGYHEEVWMSKMNIGECYSVLKDWPNALTYYMEAYNYHPLRSEPLHVLAHHYTEIGKNKLAMMYAKEGVMIKKPEGDRLPINHDVYNYKFHEEICINAFYTRDLDLGMQACEHLRLSRNIPDGPRWLGSSNLVYYINKLEGKLIEIKPEITDKWHAINPSIILQDDHYLMNCRTVNYTIRDDGSYNVPPEGVRTRNYLMKYDFNFKLLSQDELLDKSNRVLKSHNIQGTEDCRIFKSPDGKVRCFATTCDTNTEGIPEISICELDGNNIVSVTPMPCPEKKRYPDMKQKVPQKNWLPFTKDGELFILYKSDPLIVRKITNYNDSVDVCEHHSEMNFSEFRGSAGPVKINDKYLYVIHEVFYQRGQKKRTYIHRFVELNNEFKITNISFPFYFINKTIEYCCGMCMSHDGKSVLLTFGYDDNKAYLLEVPIQNVDKIMYGPGAHV